MTAVRSLRVVMLVDDENVHHRRFAGSLRDRGHDVRVVPIGADVGKPEVVIAGPLPHVAECALLSSDAPLVAVSWGSDLLRDVPADPVLEERTAAVLARAATVIVDSRVGERAAVALGAIPDRVFRFPWGIDLEAHPQQPMPSPPLRVVSLRQFVPEYRVDTLVHALALAPGIVVDLAGGGPEEGRLRTMAIGLGVADRVRFHGRVAERAVPGLLAGAHLHVSTVPSDGSSISLLQALACGRPSVVVDNAANREWIEEGTTGWLVPPGDHEALAVRLRAIATDLSVLRPIAAAGRALALARADWRMNCEVLWRAVEVAVDGGADATWS